MNAASDRHPRAITMWDFSWLERRWAGAGYEDWDRVLHELADRGYDVVRIDAYPHLVSAGPERHWTLKPYWTQQAWGAQSAISVRVLPELLDFIRAAGRHGMRVALSTWFRQDVDDVRMRLTTPERIAQAWIDTLRHIDRAGLLGLIDYVACGQHAHIGQEGSMIMTTRKILATADLGCQTAYGKAPFLWPMEFDFGPGLPRQPTRLPYWPTRTPRCESIGLVAKDPHGFRPAYHDARGEGWNVNLQRLWREEGLRMTKRLDAADRPAARAEPGVGDFQFDATTDGRPVKIVSIIEST